MVLTESCQGDLNRSSLVYSALVLLLQSNTERYFAKILSHSINTKSISLFLVIRKAFHLSKSLALLTLTIEEGDVAKTSHLDSARVRVCTVIHVRRHAYLVLETLQGAKKGLTELVHISTYLGDI